MVNIMTGIRSGTFPMFSRFLASFPRNQITQSVILPDGHFQLSATGVSGYTYSIQSSLLVTGPWNTVTNITADTNGLIQFEDTTTPHPATQFYRTVITP